MEKKESLKKENNLNLNIKPHISKISHWVFGISKFILGISLLPFVWSASLSLVNELALIDKLAQNYFWAGLISLLVIYLFIWEPAAVYAGGHKILEAMFKFFGPLVKTAPYLLPIYTIVLAILYIVLSGVVKSPNLANYFIFLLGFSVSLHLVFSAKTLRAKKEDFLKGNYIFGFSFVYIVNLAILSFFLSLIFDNFSFVNFSNQTFQIAKGIFSAVFRQIFL
jgi:hypothetical protein